MKRNKLLILGAAFALAISGCAGAVQLTRMSPLREGTPDTKTDVLFAKGFGGYTANSFSAAGTDKTAVANSTNASGSTYALQVFNGSTGAVRGNQSSGSANFSARNTTVLSNYYISSISLTVSGGTIDGSTSGRSVVYFGSSAFANPNTSAPSGTSTAASPASSGQTTLTWTNSDTSLNYFVLYNLKTSGTALSKDASTSLEITWTEKSSSGNDSSSTSESSEPNSSSSSSSQGATIINATFADALAAGQALAHNTSTDDYYKFQGYVRVKQNKNYFLTATSDEELISGTSDAAHNSKPIYTNAIELYSITDSTLAGKLLDGAYIDVVTKLKNYNGTVENDPSMTNDNVTVLSQGTAWQIQSITVAQALEIVNGLSNGATTQDAYQINGFIVTSEGWNSSYNNITFELGDEVDSAAENRIKVFRATQGDNTVGKDLAVADQVKVVGNLQKYVSNDVVTPEVTSCTATLLVAGENHPIVVDHLTEATPKTISQINGYSAADSTLIAKVEGVAEDLRDTTYGNFYLANPQSGEAVYVYGGYTSVTFQKAGNNYSVKEKTNPITSAVIGHEVTVYGLVDVHNGEPQLKFALVVPGNACSSNVSASISVNDNEMGSASLSSNSPAYGAEVTITLNPAQGYHVKGVDIQRASHKEAIDPVEGVYKFNAEAKNEVSVTFEAEPESSGNFALYTDDIAEGDYVIYYSDKAAKALIANNRLSYAELTPTNNIISNPDLDVVWHISQNGENWVIYNADSAKYLASTGTKNQAALEESVTDKATWTITKEGSTFEIENISNKAGGVNSLLRNNGTNGFATYSSSTGGALSLYKKADNGSTSNVVKENIESLTTHAKLSYSVTKSSGSGIKHILNNANAVKSTSNTYSDWAYSDTFSQLAYSGFSGGDHSSIQLRSNSNDAGVVVTTNGKGFIAKTISIKWNEASGSGRTIDVYGKKAVYESPADLYNADADVQGTLIGSISYDGENKTGTLTLNSADSYTFIGVRSASGALYLDSIEIQWGDTPVYTYSEAAIRFGGTIDPTLWTALKDEVKEIVSYGVMFKAGDVDVKALFNNSKTDSNTIAQAISAAGITDRSTEITNEHQTPYSVGDNYVWNLGKRITSESDLTAMFSAAAYIRVKDDEDNESIIFLQSVSTSAKELAQEMIEDRTNNYDENSFGGSLYKLSTLQ